jgi:adenylate cyclase class 2
MRRFVYDIRAGDQGRWMRLRDTGSDVTLCVKEIVGDSIDGTRETETSVGDFQVTHELLGLLGFRPSA